MSVESLLEKAAPEPAAEEPERPRNLFEFLRQPAVRDQFEQVAPEGFSVDVMIAAACQAQRTTQGLQSCQPRSFASALMEVASLGLHLGPLQQAWLVPRKGRATFQIGWTGILELCRRSGNFVSVDAGVLRSWDELTDIRGSEPLFEVRPDYSTDPDPATPPVGYWVCVRLTGGGFQSKVMRYREVLDAVDRIDGAKRDGSAWSEWFDEMAQITCFRRLRNWLPQSVELARALTDRREGDGVTPVPTPDEDHAPSTAPGAPSPDSGGAGEQPADDSRPREDVPVTTSELDSISSSEPAPPSIAEGGPVPEGEPFLEPPPEPEPEGEPIPRLADIASWMENKGIPGPARQTAEWRTKAGRLTYIAEWLTEHDSAGEYSPDDVAWMINNREGGGADG